MSYPLLLQLCLHRRPRLWAMWNHLRGFNYRKLFPCCTLNGILLAWCLLRSSSNSAYRSKTVTTIDLWALLIQSRVSRQQCKLAQKNRSWTCIWSMRYSSPAWCLLHSSSNCTCAACQHREQCGCVVCSLYSALLIQPRVSRQECQIVHKNRSCATLSRFPLAWCLLRCCSKRAYMLRQDCEQCGQLRSVNNSFAALYAASRLSRMLRLMKSQLVYFSTQSSLLPFSALFLQFCLVVRQDCWKFDVLSLLLQSPRLSSLFFGTKSQHSTDSMFYSKQPLPCVFCALPPIVPTSCVKTLAMWMYCLPWFNHPDYLRCFLAWKVNIQLTLCSTQSSLLFCLVVRQDCWKFDVLSLLLQSPSLSSLFFGMKSQHSTDSMFYSKQPLPRVFCALPPVSPTWCAKTVAMWMYCLYCFNRPDFLRCFLAWKVNFQLTLCSTPSSLFLASSVLFLQLYLHHTSRLWQCGCIVFMDSTTQTLFDVFWHERSTFNWLYVLLPAASSSRLLCSSSNRAYIIRQDSGNVDVLSLLLQPPKLSSLFFGMKSQHSLTLCSAPSSLFLASSVLFLQSCLHHASRLWQCGCIVFIDSTTQTLFAVIWHRKSTFNWFYVLLQAASSSRLLCSSSNRAYIMRQDSGNVDVLSLLIQSPRLSSLFFGM